jgi:type II secretory pathway pseudopilin PulG
MKTPTSTQQPTPAIAETPCEQVAAAQGLRVRRCLTLIEVLIVLALLAGLAALVLPSMLDRLDERAFESAADTASEHLMMARAHAQATGEAVEVAYNPATGQVQARVYAPWSSEIDVDSSAIAPGTSPLLNPLSHTTPSPEPRQTSPADSTGSMEGGQGTIAEPWASRALGEGIRIARRPSSFPFGADAGEDTGSHLYAALADDDAETLEDLVSGQEVRLAVFMPDGSALVGDEVYLNDQRGRCGRLSVNPWSGLPMFERLADLAARTAGRNGQPSGQSADTSDQQATDDEPRVTGDDEIINGADAESPPEQWGDENDR